MIGGDHFQAGNLPLVSAVIAEELDDSGAAHKEHYDGKPPEKLNHASEYFGRV
jgi:hypothetical protein